MYGKVLPPLGKRRTALDQNLALYGATAFFESVIFISRGGEKMTKRAL